MPADAAYMREYRLRNRPAYEKNAAAGRARRRAQVRLAANHRAEFHAILSEERALEGLPPVGVLKRGRKPTDAAA